jgi:TatD family-associated radical SAM protein
MGEIVYFLQGERKKAYLNITPNYECTNNCIFCDKQVLEESIGANLKLEKEPTLDEVMAELKEKVENNSVQEFIFCGIGEPFIYLDKMLNITKHIKKEYDKSVRINTNGQAYVINPELNVVLMLQMASVDSVSVSINTMDEKTYNQMHRPKHQGVFNHVLEFVKDCNQSSIDTKVTFLEFPRLNKQEVYDFTRKLGLKDEQVRFRRYLR